MGDNFEEVKNEKVERAGGYISEIEFNTGETVKIEQNDIVVFVGPNNAGKSQALKDIYALCKNASPSIVVSEVKLEKNNVELTPFLEKIATSKEAGNHIAFSAMGTNVKVFSFTENDYNKKAKYEDFRDFFVANLDTAARLSICNPVENIARDENRKHPIHYAAFDEKYAKWLSDNYRKAFGERIIPNSLFGGKIPLCIGEEINIADETDFQKIIYEGAKTLEKYKQVQDQGDGIKSFTGILLYLMLDYYSTFLIDEPESFLHPPQANIMGQIIGESLAEDQQAFISTHSEEIIKGLMSVCPKRIKIVRITREKNINTFSVLENDKFNEIWNDSLLKHSNIMNSLFHKQVILCESDSDCKLYSIIESYLLKKENKYSETLYIHCGGKQRMAKITNALKSLNIQTRLIPDIDVLNDQEVFKGIVEAFGIEWDNIKRNYNILVSNLHSSKERIKRNEAEVLINNVLSSSKEAYLSNKEIESIRSAIKTISKWGTLKENGKNAVPRGDATTAFGEIDAQLKEHGIYMVPVGELENFVKEVGGLHGPAWVNEVLEKYPDLEDSIYDEIKNFITTVISHIEKKNGSTTEMDISN